jgi:hypothetical protein
MSDTYRWLLNMPRTLLHGTAAGIEKWCRTNEKCRPTLLDRPRS